jgi:hypothetical protein
MTRVGSRDYWRDLASYPRDWAARAAQAAHLILPGWTVLDLGCGPHMALRDHLPAGCSYRPADLYRWSPEVLHADIDADLFPDVAVDCVVLLGVIEYLTQPQLAFRFARSRAAAMVVSYCHPLTPDPVPRARAGWINAFSPQALAELVAGSGWLLARSDSYGKSGEMHQLIHVLYPAALPQGVGRVD